MRVSVTVHMPTVRGVLRRVLEPGGHLALDTPNAQIEDCYLLAYMRRVPG